MGEGMEERVVGTDSEEGKSRNPLIPFPGALSDKGLKKI